ncbi:HAD family hydrolase [Fictibacillus enclensis]|uniref:HAD family hydrolase n=1 Tax=Fictibacillus enclensis TaxID=1017270 RepID=UPI0024C0A2BB|nr:HAD family hydrolase [Fictibacillus enclensis]WHY71040.1 HAD family hydrolase [Fictibacillus enclensis]
MKINTLVFDLDDTLFNEQDYVLSGFKAVGQWVENALKTDQFYNNAVKLFNNGVTEQLFNRTLETLDISYNQDMIIDMVNVYRSHRPNIQLFEDARWLFNEINENVKVGLITDGYLVAQQMKVEALNIKHKFNAIIFSDTLGREYWKPSPIPYERLIYQLNSDHKQCVYIGDNVTKDFITAKWLGWKTVQISRGDGIYSNTVIKQSQYQADYKIEEFKELLNIKELRHLFKKDKNKVVVET